MPSTRRRFLRQAASMGLLYPTAPLLQQMTMPGGMPPARSSGARPARVAANQTVKMLHTLELPLFVDSLPLPTVVRPPLHRGKREIDVTMREVHAKVHRDVPATRMWSYGPDALAPLLEVRRGEPVDVRWINNLPTKHFLPVDHSLHGSGRDVPEVRAIAHLHGAKTHSKSDGYPEDWFVPGKSLVAHYPFDQDATALWFHDHAMGINRLNVYAGLFGMLLIRDNVEDALRLPSGKYEIPLLLYDRDFGVDGQLYYGNSGDPEHPWVPEWSADGIVVNGKIGPYLEVEPTVYRFRAVDTANSRFFNLSLSNGQPLTLIGGDQGLLAAPLTVNRVSMAPAERTDFLVDFSHAAGQRVRLLTEARPILEFRVAEKAETRAFSVPKELRPIQRTPESAAIKTRTITLHEYDDKHEQPMVMLINRKHWHEPTTEFPKLNSTEIWEFVNLTEDTHPMHLHLVRFQVLDRRKFDPLRYLRENTPHWLAEAEPPEPHEMGWKDVVHCPPDYITRIIVRFEGYTGKYLYHCHILEHEANDMMRPFEVVA